MGWGTRRRSIIGIYSTELEYIASSKWVKHTNWSHRFDCDVAEKDNWREKISFKGSNVL